MEQMDEDQPLVELHPLRTIKETHEIAQGVEVNIIKTLNYNDDFPQANELAELACKILVINYETTDRGLAYVQSSYFQRSFFTYPRAFIIIINGNREVNLEDLEGINRTFGRPIIPNSENLSRPIIICNELVDQSCTIFYRKEEEESFQAIDWNDSQEFCFKQLMHRIRSGLYGNFNGNFLETRVNVSESLNFTRLIDQAFDKNDLLCIRFLQLFDPALNGVNQEGFKPFEYATRSGDIHGFLAAFGVSFELQPFDIKELSRQQNAFLFDQTYSRGFNLLMMAAEHGKAKCVHFLLHLGFFNIDQEVEVNDLKWTAADIAYEQACRQPDDSNERSEAFSTLYLLLINNSPFPKDFIAGQHLSQELHDFVAITREFSECILVENIPRLTEIIEEFPNLRHFYDTNNKSGAAQAIEYRKTNIFEFLVQHNITMHPRENLQDLLIGANENFRRKIGEINISYARENPDSYIWILKGNSFLSPDTRNDREMLQYIAEAYKYLNGISDIVPILKIVAAFKNFKIINDFNHNSTFHVDPTTNIFTMGVFCSPMLIIIGAAGLLTPETKSQVYGTLAHELTHFAVFLTYQNGCLPYYSEEFIARNRNLARINESNRNRFLDVFNRTLERAGSFPHLENDHVRSVLNYNANKRQAELPPRVLHIRAEFKENPTERQTFIERYFMLFEYFDSDILPDVTDAIQRVACESYERFKDLQFHFKHSMSKPKHYKYKMFAMISIIIILILLMFGYGIWSVRHGEKCCTFKDVAQREQDKLYNNSFYVYGKNFTFKNVFGSWLLPPLTCEAVRRINDGKLVVRIGKPIEFYLNGTIDRRYENSKDKQIYIIGELPFLNKENINILNATTGGGKTTTLQEIHRKITETDKGYWVERLDMKNFKNFKNFDKLQLNQSSNFINDILPFFTKSFLNLTDDEAQYFKAFFINRNRVSILIDNFNEIDDFEQKVMIEFLISMIDAGKHVILWFTPYPKNYYIVQLVSKFSVVTILESLEDFLAIQVASSQISEEYKMEIEKFIRKLVDERTIGADNLLIPDILVKMVHLNLSLNDLNLSQVMDRFVNDNLKSNQTKIDFLKLFAIEDFFGLNFPGLNLDIVDIKNLTRHQNLKISIRNDFNGTEIVRDGKIWHGTIEEFFIAIYLKFDFWRSNDKEEIKARFELLFYVVLNDHGQTDFALKFLKELLEIKKPSEVEEIHKFSRVFDDFFKTALDVYLPAICYGKTEVKAPEKIELLTEFFNQTDKNLVKALWNSIDDQPFISRLYREPANQNEIRKVIQVAEKYFNEKEMKQLRVGKNQRGNLLFYMWLNREVEDNKKFIQNVLKEVEKEVKVESSWIQKMNQTVNIQTIDEHLINKTKNLSQFYKVAEILEDFLTSEEFDEIFRTNRLAMLIPVNSELQLQNLQKLLKYGNRVDFKKFLNINAYSTISVLQMSNFFSDEAFELLLKTLKNNLSRNELIKISTRHQPILTPFTFAVDQNERVEKIEMFWNFLVENKLMTKVEILRSRSLKEQLNALHYATLNPNVTIFEFIVKLYEKYLPNEVLNMIVDTNVGKISLLFKIFNSTFETSKRVWKYLMDNNIDVQRLKNILNKSVFKNVNATELPQFCELKKFIVLNYSRNETVANFNWIENCNNIDEDSNQNFGIYVAILAFTIATTLTTLLIRYSFQKFNFDFIGSSKRSRTT